MSHDERTDISTHFQESQQKLSALMLCKFVESTLGGAEAGAPPQRVCERMMHGANIDPGMYITSQYNLLTNMYRVHY